MTDRLSALKYDTDKLLLSKSGAFNLSGSYYSKRAYLAELLSASSHQLYEKNREW
jgi:hypothetical protein